MKNTPHGKYPTWKIHPMENIPPCKIRLSKFENYILMFVFFSVGGKEFWYLCIMHHSPKRKKKPVSLLISFSLAQDKDK
jgi:hypothetical protein